MKYLLIKDKHQEQILQNKLGELEGEHARLTMELKLAAATGIENESVEQARRQLAILDAQHAAVTAWLGLDKKEPENGQVDEETLEAVKAG